jgi:hypothetical protein
MPLDRRLRDGLSGLASDVDADVEHHLHEAVGAARRRVRTRQVMLRVGAIALVGAGIVGALQLRGDGDDAGQVATEPGIIDPADSHPELLAGAYRTEIPAITDGDSLVNGTWVATITAEGTIDLEAPPAFTGTRSGLVRVTDDLLETDLFVSDLCSGQLPGRYHWERSATTLSLTPVADTCAPRQRLLTSQVWVVTSDQ